MGAMVRAMVRAAAGVAVENGSDAKRRKDDEANTAGAPEDIRREGGRGKEGRELGAEKVDRHGEPGGDRHVVGRVRRELPAMDGDGRGKGRNRPETPPEGLLCDPRRRQQMCRRPLRKEETAP